MSYGAHTWVGTSRQYAIDEAAASVVQHLADPSCDTVTLALPRRSRVPIRWERLEAALADLGVDLGDKRLRLEEVA